MTRARDIANFLNGGGTIGGDLDISGDLDSLSGLTTINYPLLSHTAETYATNTSTSGDILSATNSPITWLTADQTANRTYNSRYLDFFLTSEDGDTVLTQAVLFTNGTTPYVINDVISSFVFTNTLDLKWQGGAAPTAGNANSIDLYTFTFIRTSEDNYTCFASQPVKYA
jgi:hypothetical protein